MHYPLIIEAQELEKHLENDNLLIIDLCNGDAYKANHIPGAIHFDYSHIVKVEKPVMGKVPDDEQLTEIFSSLGITSNTHVVAYDDEGGGKACRLLWTLELCGHQKLSLLNGGIFSWVNKGHPLSHTPAYPSPAHFELHKDLTVLATREYIQGNLDNDQIQMLDARSLAEYHGRRNFALKGGHIPGAIHYEWTDAMDKNNNLCLLPIEDIQKTLMNKGFDKNSTIVAYCHSHHRSSFSYYTLKAAGFNKVMGYAGSWSEWGNHPDTPVEN